MLYIASLTVSNCSLQHEECNGVVTYSCYVSPPPPLGSCHAVWHYVLKNEGLNPCLPLLYISVIHPISPPHPTPPRVNSSFIVCFYPYDTITPHHICTHTPHLTALTLSYAVDSMCGNMKDAIPAQPVNIYTLHTHFPFYPPLTPLTHPNTNTHSHEGQYTIVNQM